jgi:hypothetical protein
MRGFAIERVVARRSPGERFNERGTSGRRHLLHGSNLKSSRARCDEVAPLQRASSFWFVESTTGTRRALQWSLLDVSSTIKVVALETLEQGSGSAWPMPPLPAGVESGTTFTMQPSGAIRWEIPDGSRGVQLRSNA